MEVVSSRKGRRRVKGMRTEGKAAVRASVSWSGLLAQRAHMSPGERGGVDEGRESV